MADLKKGIIGVILTVVAVIFEYVLFPIVLSFQSSMNSTCIERDVNSTCIGGGEWISASDRTLLQRNSSLMILIIIVTLIGGVMFSVYVGIAQK